MPVCAPNSSQPRTGAAVATFLTQSALQIILNRYGLGWLANLIQATSPIYTFDLTSLCAVDPPADPGVTGADVASVIALGRGPLTATAADKIDQLVTRFVWYALCECSNNTVPTPPAAPSAPSGLPAVNPNGQVGTGAGACATFDIDFSYTSGGPSTTVGRFPIPLGATNVAVTSSYSPGDPAIGHAPNNGMETWAALTGGSVINNYGSIGNSVPTEITRTFAISSTANFFSISGGPGFATIPGTVHNHIEFFCGSAGGVNGGPACSECPPDPVLQGQLASILQLLTLLQRQQVPFAYISGTAHHSLTGSGTLAVQGILGALLNVSIPTSYGTAFGTPDTRFEVGFIRFGTNDGYAEAITVDTDSQVIFPESAGLYTLIAYSLSPGVSMTLTELIRES